MSTTVPRDRAQPLTELRAPPATGVARWSLAQFVLFSATLAILGAAIGWPGILREPASTVLRTIHGQALATSLGYWLYLLASVAFIGLALSLGRLLRPSSSDSAAIDLLTVLGVAAGVLKTLGIVRWLSVMPGLAASYNATDTPAAMQPMIELVYTSMNAYAGAVGELLGVQLFSGLWMVGIGSLLLRQGWKASGLLGIGSGLLLLVVSLRIFVDDLGALNAVAGPMGLAWYLVLAIAAWRHRVPSTAGRP